MVVQVGIIIIGGGVLSESVAVQCSRIIAEDGITFATDG